MNLPEIERIYSDTELPNLYREHTNPKELTFIEFVKFVLEKSKDD